MVWRNAFQSQGDPALRCYNPARRPWLWPAANRASAQRLAQSARGFGPCSTCGRILPARGWRHNSKQCAAGACHWADNRAAATQIQRCLNIGKVAIVSDDHKHAVARLAKGARDSLARDCLLQGLRHMAQEFEADGRAICVVRLVRSVNARLSVIIRRSWTRSAAPTEVVASIPLVYSRRKSPQGKKPWPAVRAFQPGRRGRTKRDRQFQQRLFGGLAAVSTCCWFPGPGDRLPATHPGDRRSGRTLPPPPNRGPHAQPCRTDEQRVARPAGANAPRRCNPAHALHQSVAGFDGGSSVSAQK